MTLELSPKSNYDTWFWVRSNCPLLIRLIKWQWELKLRSLVATNFHNLFSNFIFHQNCSAFSHGICMEEIDQLCNVHNIVKFHEFYFNICIPNARCSHNDKSCEKRNFPHFIFNDFKIYSTHRFAKHTADMFLNFHIFCFLRQHIAIWSNFYGKLNYIMWKYNVKHY